MPDCKCFGFRWRTGRMWSFHAVELPGRRFPNQADVRITDEAKDFVNAVVPEFGRLDMLIKNIGGSPGTKVEKSNVHFAVTISNLNLVGPLFFLARAEHDHTVRAGLRNIVKIANVSGVWPSPGSVTYDAAYSRRLARR